MTALSVLYEDNHLLIVNKEPGVLVQSDKTRDKPLLDIGKEDIKEKDQRPGNVFLGTVIADSANADRLYTTLIWMISTHRVADRPDRIEPRLIKRRPKPYKLLQEPRHIARKRLLK